MKLELHLYDADADVVIGAAEVWKDERDPEDDEAMANLGRKLCAWLDECVEHYKQEIERSLAKCDCFAQQSELPVPMRRHSSECAIWE